MRKTFSALAIIAIALLTFSLVGCNEPIEDNGEKSDAISYSSESAGDMNCVIVYSQHMNSKASTSGIEKYIRGTKEALGYLAFVKLDGKPSVEYREQTKNENKNERRIKEENDEFVRDKMTTLVGIKASEEEVNILDSLKKANEELGQAANSDLENVVVIIGTGLSTTGDIDLSMGLTSLDLADYKSWMEKEGLLPNLDHIDRVVWYGFDKVDEPQEEFPNENLKKELMSFYETILTSAGVKTIEFENNGEAANSSSDLPSVSVVAMPAKPKYFNSGDVEEVSADVLFKPDQAEFLDDADPRQNEQVVKVANSIKTNNLHVTVTGYTAHYNTSVGCEALSLARADAIKDILIELGCPESSITTVGGGWGPYGEGSEEIDQMNRCVQFKFE